MSDGRRETFQRMFERADLARVPTLGGWTRKVAELSQHRANFGKVNESGEFFVQVSRKPDYGSDQTIDFFGCLEFGVKRNALLICRYIEPVALEEYPGIVYIACEAGLSITVDNAWLWTVELSKQSGRDVSDFWKNVADRRVLRKRAA